MNKEFDRVRHIGPRGVEYPNKKACEDAWDNYYNNFTYIGPDGEQYMNKKECEDAWEKYNNKTSQRKGRK